MFAFISQTWAMYLATFLVGLGSITLMTVNPTFIVAAGYSDEQQALRLTRMNQSIFAGAVVMGAVLALSEALCAHGAFVVVGISALLALLVTRIDSQKSRSPYAINNTVCSGVVGKRALEYDVLDIFTGGVRRDDCEF
ncbi:hypothetical protein [Vibrio thalassae]|nr:hypothetical protein [Vibrio thalassae]